MKIQIRKMRNRSHWFMFLLWLMAWGIPNGVTAQEDSITAPLRAIIDARQELAVAIEQDQRLDVQFWLDSLQRMDSTQYLPLHWDERWLLYIWLENYTALFTEVALFDNGLQETEYYKISPPEDSLFTQLDHWLYEDRAYLFDQIRKGFLSTEERGFTTLMLSYLLRLNITDAEKVDNDDQLSRFLKKYPKSRFSSFIRNHMFYEVPGGNEAIALDLLFLQGNWSDGLEKHFRPLFGAEIGLAYSYKRWIGGARFAFGGQKVDRDVDENRFIWPEDDPSTFLAVELETGIDLINRPRIRILPLVGGGFSTLRPPEDDESPNPDYYDHFKFNGWHLTAAIQADVKFGLGSGNIKGSYHGVRVRLGHRWLNFRPDNPALAGDMFFFAVGYTLFGRQPMK